MTWQRSGSGNRKMSRSRMNVLMRSTEARASETKVSAAPCSWLTAWITRATSSRRPSVSSGGNACFGK